MTVVPFPELPDDSRLWIFPLSRALTAVEEVEVRNRIESFLRGWAAHGTPLTAGSEWVEGRFLLVAVDESTVPPSGCSIDDLVRVLKEEGARLGMTFLDHAPIWFRQEGMLCRVSRANFGELAKNKKVTLDTPVFDNAITRLSHYRSGLWEKPASLSWHGKAFFSGT